MQALLLTSLLISIGMAVIYFNEMRQSEQPYVLINGRPNRTFTLILYLMLSVFWPIGIIVALVVPQED